MRDVRNMVPGQLVQLRRSRYFSFALALGVSLCVGSSLFAAENPWQPRLNKDGVEVWTRKVDGSAILEFKSKVTLDVPIDKVVWLYENNSRVPEWFYQCISSELVADEGDQVHVLYAAMDLPWPAATRDVIFRRIKTVDPSTGEVTYTLSALPDRLPLRKGRIRVPYLKTTWRLIPLPDGRIEIHFQQHSDAGGSIPKFLANALVLDIPYQSLRNLRALITKELKGLSGQ